MSGWIKLHRKLLDSVAFDNPELLQVWIWCLLKASHKGHEQMIGLQVQPLKEGQFVFGRKRASQELKMTESKIYRLIKKLELLESITIKSNNKYSVVTIEKWGDYQSTDNESEQQTNNKRTTNEQQMNTNKNVKNVKNVNKNIYNDFEKQIINLFPGRKTKAVRDKKVPVILKEFTTEEITRAMERYRDETKDTDKRFILNESTWWNGRYLDYMDINYSKPEVVKKALTNPNNRFHNFDQRTSQYTVEELNKKIEDKAEQRKREYLERLKG